MRYYFKTNAWSHQLRRALFVLGSAFSAFLDVSSNLSVNVKYSLKKIAVLLRLLIQILKFVLSKKSTQAEQMIYHILKQNLLHLTLPNKDFSHRIPVEKIGKAIQWNIGEKGSKCIVIRNVSRLTLRLFTQQITEEKYLQQFKSIVQEYAPKNNIDWKATLLAVTIQNEYNSLRSLQETAATKMTSEEIIGILEEKYGLD
jgi:hypothetical protein